MKLLHWFSSVVLSLGLIPGGGQVLAQSPQLCGTDDSFEPTSPVDRVVALPQFQLQVTIPSNYRAIARQSGAVEILHPDDFAMIQCVARGGLGGHGYYSETINLVPDNPTQTLREQARWAMGYQETPQGRKAIASTVQPYDINGFSGFLVATDMGYSVTFLGRIPGDRRLLEVTAACDCPVGLEAVTDLLDRLEPLPP